MATSISQTNPRHYHKCAVGKKFQPAKGIASTPDIFLKEADFDPNPGIIEFDPQGTHGSKFQLKQGIRTAYSEPICKIAYWASRSTLGVALENFTGGKTLCQSANVGYSSQSFAAASSLIFSGIRLPDHVNNMTSANVFFSVESATGSGIVRVYSTASGAPSVLIASAPATSPGNTFTAAAVNNSGITVSGTLVTATAAVTGVQINETQMTWADTPHSLAWYTLEIDTGYENLEFADCWTKSLTIQSVGRTGVRVEEEVVSLLFSEDATALTASIDDNEFFAVRDITGTFDQAGTNYSVPTDGAFSLTGSWDIVAGPDNASGPLYFIRDNVDMLVTVDVHPSDESNVIQDRARAVTYNTLNIDFSYGDIGATFLFDDVKANPNSLLKGSGKAIDKQTITFNPRADGTASTPNLCTIKLQHA